VSDASLHEAHYLAAHLHREGFEQEVKKNPRKIYTRHIYSVRADRAREGPPSPWLHLCQKKLTTHHAPGGELCEESEQLPVHGQITMGDTP
jgi:hypothetical protein